MSMSAMPVSFWRFFSSRSTWAWTVTSRAVVGSSATMTLALQHRAMAMMTRWHMPPESSKG